MSTSVLYDEPGPRARRISLIGTVVAGVLILAGLVLAGMRLADRGQFAWELWSPVLDPSDENFELVWRLLGKGLAATLIAAGLSIAFSLVAGTLLGVLRMMLGASRSLAGRVLLVPLVAVMELLRGLPVVLSVFYVYLLTRAQQWDITWLPGEDGLWFLVIGLTLYNSVIIAEILRAGVASLPRGQAEAGLAVGLRPRQVMFLIQLPQAFRTMLPALISQLVVVLKDTSLAAVLALYTELLRRSNLIALNLDNPIQMLFVAGVIFIVINYLLSRLSVYLEHRLSHGKKTSQIAPAQQPTVDPGLGNAGPA